MVQLIIGMPHVPTLASEERVELTKPISLVYITDNIFDIYGNLDELILFTAAVSRWKCQLVIMSLLRSGGSKRKIEKVFALEAFEKKLLLIMAFLCFYKVSNFFVITFSNFKII